mgnify:CR=1 FL=1
MANSFYHRPVTRYLSVEQTDRLHEAGLEILESVGSYVYEDESLDLFRKAGARVERDGRVFIPPKLVEWGLSVTDKNITLHDRNGNPVMPLKQGSVYFGTGSDCIFVLDHRNNRRREGTIADIEEISRVCDALPNIDFIMSVTVPSDISTEEANRRQMLAMVENSTKPIMFVTNDFESSIDVTAAAEIVAGGGPAHRQKPYACCYINVTDPLRHNEESLRKLLLFAEKGVPTTYTPMVIRGVNGPVTRAGATALANAGELLGLVLAQLKNEGAPILHSGGYGDGFDMGTSVTLYAGPESFGARSDMAAHYNLPIFGLGGASDSKLVDGQSASEAALSIMSEAMGGVNLIHDVGYIESGMCYSLEQLVICNEIIGYVRRYAEGITVNDESLALDLIKEQGPHGEYLSTEHTVEHFRDDWFPELFDRNNHDTWKAQGGTDLHRRAMQQLENILENYTPAALEPEKQKEIREILLRK